MSSSKIQPLDKTVVTEFKVQMADIHMRHRVMNGSQAARVARDGSFVTADANVTSEKGVTLTDIKRVIVIQGWNNLLISLKNETGSIERIPCTGLFIMYGSFDEVTIRAQSEGDPVRISYLYA